MSDSLDPDQAQHFQIICKIYQQPTLVGKEFKLKLLVTQNENSGPTDFERISSLIFFFITNFLSEIGLYVSLL